MREKIVTATEYRKEIFNKIENYIKLIIDIDKVVIGGDYNQDIAPNEVRLFCERLGVRNTHYYFNLINLEELDHTY